MTEYTKAPASVVALAKELIDLYHPDLKSARIGLLMRDVAPESNGRATLGKAKKTPPEWQIYAPYDFVIWLAEDRWFGGLTHLQQRAVLDHELTHCLMLPDGSTRIRPHDIEEFAEIIERYDYYLPHYYPMKRAVQARMNFAVATGRVEAATPDAAAIFNGSPAPLDYADMAGVMRPLLFAELGLEEFDRALADATAGQLHWALNALPVKGADSRRRFLEDRHAELINAANPDAIDDDPATDPDDDGPMVGGGADDDIDDQPPAGADDSGGEIGPAFHPDDVPPDGMGGDDDIMAQVEGMLGGEDYWENGEESEESAEDD